MEQHADGAFRAAQDFADLGGAQLLHETKQHDAAAVFGTADSLRARRAPPDLARSPPRPGHPVPRRRWPARAAPLAADDWSGGCWPAGCARSGRARHGTRTDLQRRARGTSTTREARSGRPVRSGLRRRGGRVSRRARTCRSGPRTSDRALRNGQHPGAQPRRQRGPDRTESGARLPVPSPSQTPRKSIRYRCPLDLERPADLRIRAAGRAANQVLRQAGGCETRPTSGQDNHYWSRTTTLLHAKWGAGAGAHQQTSATRIAVVFKGERKPVPENRVAGRSGGRHRVTR